MALLCLLLAGCEHMTIAPPPAQAHAIAFNGNVQNAGLIDCDSNGCTVTANWLEHYRQMEGAQKWWTISADANIKLARPDVFRISYEVKEHFEKLLAAESGP